MLAARGYADPAAASAYLDSDLGSLGDPFALDGMHDAVQRLRRAISSGERVAIYGDYDADGVTSTALLVRVFRALGLDAVPFLPNRFDEGYGLSVDGLARCIETTRPRLILTADCGSCSAQAVKVAGESGVDVVITDHHEINGPLAGTTVVNPKKGSDRALTGLAGVGVAFKFAHALAKSLRADGCDAAIKLDLRRVLDLVAVGTVADVAPLSGENRILVRAGLRELNRRPCPGLAALMDRAGVRMPVDSRQIGFVIGPRLNAAGRLSDVGPEEALALLLCGDRDDAKPYAERLERANEERRRIEADVLELALKQVPAGQGHQALAVGGEGWHAGTIGIVASRLCSRFMCPAAVVTMEKDGSGKGSCRSVEGLDVVQALSECAEHLDAYGGHAMAAGFHLKPGALCGFRTAFSDACGRRAANSRRSELLIDSWVSLGDVNGDLVAACGRCEPFGLGNPAPVWAASGVVVGGRPRVVGGKHLAFRVSDGSTEVPAIAFYKGDEAIGDGAVDVAFRAAMDTYRGGGAVQLQVVSWRIADGSCVSSGGTDHDPK